MSKKESNKTYYEKNKDAARTRNKRWIKENYDSHRLSQRKYRLKKTYGITLLDYSTLLISQNNQCAICESDEPGGRIKHFHVDHDHRTGKVRGLLCNNCNRGLGNFKDSEKSLEKAVEYIRRYNAI